MAVTVPITISPGLTGLRTAAAAPDDNPRLHNRSRVKSPKIPIFDRALRWPKMAVLLALIPVFACAALFPLLGKVVTPAANMAKAIFFGLVLATLSSGFLVPYVYFPHAGAGIFGSGYGWKLVFAIYLWHFIFGVNLGMMYNPLPLDDPAFKVDLSQREDIVSIE